MDNCVGLASPGLTEGHDAPVEPHHHVLKHVLRSLAENRILVVFGFVRFENVIESELSFFEVSFN